MCGIIATGVYQVIQNLQLSGFGNTCTASICNGFFEIFFFFFFESALHRYIAS